MAVHTVVMRDATDHLTFVAAGIDDELAAPLLAELSIEYSDRYGGTPELLMDWLRGDSGREFTPPAGGLYLGVLDGVAVTGGAFTRYDDDTAELKRIWTDRNHRQRGFGTRLLAVLEAEITARGYRRIYLTTGHLQPEAEALYLATGYRRLAIELPAEGDGTVFPIAFEKTLEPL